MIETPPQDDRAAPIGAFNRDVVTDIDVSRRELPLNPHKTFGPCPVLDTKISDRGLRFRSQESACEKEANDLRGDTRDESSTSAVDAEKRCNHQQNEPHCGDRHKDRREDQEDGHADGELSPAEFPLGHVGPVNVYHHAPQDRPRRKGQ